jgi:NTP pyrophosphatase (non-canonical NTP hydrolase)
MSDNSMTFDQYSYGASLTAKYPEAGEGSINAINYTVLGLTGEAGETANVLKKVFRDESAILTDKNRMNIADELGDVLWYAARLAEELGFTLSDIAQRNLDKLEDRNNRGVISGSGDYR